MRLLYSFVFAALSLGSTACTRPQAIETKAPSAMEPPVVVPMAVDLPKLVGYSIEEVRQLLGPPLEAQLEPPVIQPDPLAKKSLRVKDEGWTNTFETRGVTLVVTFNTRTRVVRDIVLTGNNEEELMLLGNLTLTAPSYIVLPVLDPMHASELKGVRIVGRR